MHSWWKETYSSGRYDIFIFHLLFILEPKAISAKLCIHMTSPASKQGACHRMCWSVHAPSSYVSFQALNMCKQKKQPAAKNGKIQV